MLLLLQAAETAAPRIDWSEIFQWERLIAAGIKAAFIILLAFISYRVVKLLTRRMDREIEEEDPIVKRVREQRAKTLAALLNNIALVIIIAIAVIMIIRGFGIDVGPLLATAGVVGLAISFGAQSLVKDVISGAFILLEGQYGIGDVVRIGTTAGLVEKITLRTTILRDVEGVVHIIPNGQIDKVSNLTKTWSRAVLDVGIAYHEDVDRALSVLRAVGLEMRADANWEPLLIDDPEVLGVEKLADSGVVLRIMAKTIPLKQWEVARELRRRIKNRFDREGIEIPFPHVKVITDAANPGDRPLADSAPRRADSTFELDQN